VPTYLVQYTTPESEHAERFTLDDDLPLQPQVPQVVEEIRLRGRILRGGPDDELAVFWNGVELNLAQAPRELGISPSRPLELKMRPRAQVSHRLVADRYLPKASYAGTLIGATAAAACWAIGLCVFDLPALPERVSAFAPALADALLAGLVGFGVGGAVLGFAAYRNCQPFTPAMLRGAVTGAPAVGLTALAVSAAVSALAPVAGSPSILLLRLLAWTLLAGSLAIVLVRSASGADAASSSVGIGLGAAAGTMAGLVFNLPGALAPLWQGLALALVGASAGYVAVALPLRGARALLEVEAQGQRAVGLLGARGLLLGDAAQTPLADLGRGGTTPAWGAFAWFDGTHVILQPDTRFAGAPTVRVGDALVTEALRLGDGEAIDVGETRYRLHVIRGATA
jgi:hypothetical protein